jgi:hypothetical protein
MDVKPYKIPHPFRKLKKELIDAIVKDIEEGSTHKLASESNGITNRIFDIWRNQGRVDIEHQEDSLCAYLVLSLSKVKQNEVKWCRSVIKESDKGHKGAEWTLEHAYWREFGSSAPSIELAKDIENLQSEKGIADAEANSGSEKEDSKK